MKPLILLLFLAGTVRAADLPCGPAEKGAVELDGMTDDWKEVEGIDAGGRDSNLSFTLKCNVDPTTLYLLIDVRDNYFVRTKAARPGEDHLELTLGGKKLHIYPGNAGDLKDKVTPLMKGLKIASALQEKGWAIELGIPLAQVPGYKTGSPSVTFNAKVADCDSKTTLKTERTVDSSGNITFAEGESALAGFLQERRLKKSDIFFDQGIALGRKAGGRVIMAGRYLAAITDGYVYMELPFHDRKDLKETKVFDLAGDGRGALVLRYVERAGGGARELLSVYRFDADKVNRVFMAEVGKSQGANRIDDKVSYVRRGKATDILIETGSAAGFSQATYHESPAEDAIPVLLPWGDDRRARYQFRGDEYLRQ